VKVFKKKVIYWSVNIIGGGGHFGIRVHFFIHFNPRSTKSEL